MHESDARYLAETSSEVLWADAVTMAGACAGNLGGMFAALIVGDWPTCRFDTCTVPDFWLWAQDDASWLGDLLDELARRGYRGTIDVAATSAVRVSR